MGNKKIQKFIDKLRGKYKKKLLKLNIQNNVKIKESDLEKVNVNIQGQNNVIEVEDAHLFDKSDETRISINIDGSNNIIHIEDITLANNAYIALYISGDNNKITIKKGFNVDRFFASQMGSNHPYFGKIQNSEIFIDENTVIQSMNYFCYTNNTPLKIGKNCMIAFDINIYNTDAHPILDLNTKKVINKVKGIKLGDHIWLGANSSIMKNVTLPDDCIVGWNSVVSSSINRQIEPHSIIAGNPAKLVKRGVTWDANGAKYGYSKNEIE